MMNNQEPKTFRPGGLEITKKALEGMDITKDTSILDVGCGNGATLKYLSDTFGCKVSGVDISERAVELTKINCPSAQTLVVDAKKLPFADNSMDAVLYECSLPVIDDKIKALYEARRVVKSGGRIAATVFAKNPKEAEENFKEAGINNICVKDCSEYLTQLIVDAIFMYGSLINYLEEAEKELEGRILDCDQCTKGNGYYLVTGTKA